MAGFGQLGVNPDPLPLPADEVWLYFPTAIRPRDDGSALIADCQSHRILVLEDGMVDVLAGTTFHAPAVPGPALDSPLENPCDVWPAADGGFLIAELHVGRVLHVGLDGMLSVVVGNADAIGFGGDGGPALEARLSDFTWATIEGPDGWVFVSDAGNARIRSVDTVEGLVDTLAGDGEEDGDDGPVGTASFRDPRQMAWLGDDLLVADKTNHRIRRIDLSAGVVSTFAGTGEAGWSGDDGPATAAALNGPEGVAVGPDGTVWIADTENHVIRRVDSQGRIATAVGLPGEAGNGPREGDVSDAALANPGGVHVGSDGRVWIADTRNGQIRVFVP